MRKLIVIAAIAGSLVIPASASAHYSAGWYSSESLAEKRILVKHDDVFEADCAGWGKRFKRNLYKHFDCILETEDGSMEEWVLHVTGRRGFKLLDG